MRRSSGKTTGELISCFHALPAQQEEAGDGEMLKEWELGKGVKNQTGGKKKDCGMKSVERGKMRSSEGKRRADKSSKRKAKFGGKKGIRMREEIEKSSSRLLVLDWEHIFLSLAGRGSLT